MVGEPGVHALGRPVDVRVIARRLVQVNINTGGPPGGHPLHGGVLPDIGKLHVAVGRYLDKEEGERPYYDHHPATTGWKLYYEVS